MSSRGSLVSLPPEAASSVGHDVVVFGHTLASHELFTDDAIAGLLDTFPTEKLFALTMGRDPKRWEDNERLAHAGLRGRDLLRAVTAGRMWLNITNVDAVDPRYRDLTTRLYEELGEQLPEYRGIESHCTLLVSSPDAMVYYHVDGPPSFLWHLRGEKQVWTYPALDTTLLPTPLLEDVFAGMRHEYVPYENHFDDRAETRVLQPGEVISWPQNAPHRITNLGSLNVSLVTDHYTDAARRRARVYTANRFLRTRCHVPGRFLAPSDDGPIALAKVVANRLAKRVGLDPAGNAKAYPTPRRRVDPDAPEGISLVAP